MYESDARLRGALPQGAGIDFAISDWLIPDVTL
jgi:hypothetical protein